MGATAIPGALTKGDLDLLVRVDPGAFAATVDALGGLYLIHQPENWTDTFASFRFGGQSELPVGVHVVIGGPEDAAFAAVRRTLSRRPDLVEELNEPKRSWEDGDPDAYIEAKAAFFDRVRDEA